LPDFDVYNFLLQSGTKTAKYKSRYAQRTAQERRIIMIEIKVAIDNIQYGDLAKQFIPQLTEHLQKAKPDNKIIHMLAKMQNMPGAIAKQMLDALPQDTKDELAVYFINQNKETLLSVLGNFMEGKGIKADVTDFSVKRNQETDRKKEAEYTEQLQ